MLPQTVRIFVCTTPQDMRRSFDGLALAARELLGEDPQSGALFAFVGKRATRLKLLWWDRNGYCLQYKRLRAPWKGGMWNVNPKKGGMGTPILLRGSSPSGGDPRSEMRGDGARWNGPTGEAVTLGLGQG
jgi:hypothetical protein